MFKVPSIKKTSSGFTLIELMVSISIFSIVMIISMGAIFTTLDSNRKSQSIRTVMDNLSYTLEGMTRTIRFGNTYHCDATVVPIIYPRDCAGGSDSMTVTRSDGVQVTYKKVGTSIVRRLDGTPGGLLDGDYVLTSPDVSIQTLKFRVFGSQPYTSGDLLQPEVIIVVGGYAGTKPSTKSSFNLETTLSQRQFDFP